MANIRVKLNINGIRELLHCEEIQDDLETRAEAIADHARTLAENYGPQGEEYAKYVRVQAVSAAKRTALVRVYANAFNALAMEADHGILASSLGAGAES